MHQLDGQATQEHWDHLAAEYDRAKKRNDAYYRSLKACFDAAVPQAVRVRVLDLGCGTGQVLASLRPINGVGIDVSLNMIEVAKRQFADRNELAFAQMDGSIAAGLGEFDAVISADVLEHVSDWRAVVATIVQACRQGGVIAISTPNPWWTFPLWVLEKLRLKMPEGPHRFVAAREIAAALKDMGCNVQQVSTHAILPVRFMGLGERVSTVAERIPILRRLGVIQMVVAKRAA